MRRRDISPWTQGSSTTSQSWRHVAIFYSLFQSYFSVIALINTIFFSPFFPFCTSCLKLLCRVYGYFECKDLIHSKKVHPHICFLYYIVSLWYITCICHSPHGSSFSFPHLLIIWICLWGLKRQCCHSQIKILSTLRKVVVFERHMLENTTWDLLTMMLTLLLWNR